jgi:hypothetical protein
MIQKITGQITRGNVWKYASNQIDTNHSKRCKQYSCNIMSLFDRNYIFQSFQGGVLRSFFPRKNNIDKLLNETLLEDKCIIYWLNPPFFTRRRQYLASNTRVYLPMKSYWCSCRRKYPIIIMRSNIIWGEKVYYLLLLRIVHKIDTT